MAQLDQIQLAQIVSAVIQALQVQGTAPKAAAIAQPVDRLAAKDRALIAGLVRKGIKREDIKLMDRANPKAEYNVRPFKAWLDLGWQVRKGERSIRGLFHQSQCDRITPKAQPKAKAKPVKAKPAPATLPLV